MAQQGRNDCKMRTTSNAETRRSFRAGMRGAVILTRNWSSHCSSRGGSSASGTLSTTNHIYVPCVWKRWIDAHLLCSYFDRARFRRNLGAWSKATKSWIQQPIKHPCIHVPLVWWYRVWMQLDRRSSCWLSANAILILSKALRIVRNTNR